MANEKRLIDADRIYDAIERRYQVSGGIEHRCERDLLDLICAADTVDAVEVVRCRDCIHRRNGKDCTNPLLLSYSWGAIRNVKDDDFCSYGERRSDG